MYLPLAATKVCHNKCEKWYEKGKLLNNKIKKYVHGGGIFLNILDLVLVLVANANASVDKAGNGVDHLLVLAGSVQVENQVRLHIVEVLSNGFAIVEIGGEILVDLRHLAEDLLRSSGASVLTLGGDRLSVGALNRVPCNDETNNKYRKLD